MFFGFGERAIEHNYLIMRLSAMVSTGWAMLRSKTTQMLVTASHAFLPFLKSALSKVESMDARDCVPQMHLFVFEDGVVAFFFDRHD